MDSLLSRSGRRGETGDDHARSMKRRRRLFGRGEWNIGRVIFIFFYFISPSLITVSAVCWFLVFWIPMGKVTILLFDHVWRHPLALSFESHVKYTCTEDAPDSSILLCTYRAVGSKYWKYTVDGTNIFLINLMAVVIFVIFDFLDAKRGHMCARQAQVGDAARGAKAFRLRIRLGLREDTGRGVGRVAAHRRPTVGPDSPELRRPGIGGVRGGIDKIPLRVRKGGTRTRLFDAVEGAVLERAVGLGDHPVLDAEMGIGAQRRGGDAPVSQGLDDGVGDVVAQIEAPQLLEETGSTGLKGQVVDLAGADLQDAQMRQQGGHEERQDGVGTGRGVEVDEALEPGRHGEDDRQAVGAVGDAEQAGPGPAGARAWGPKEEGRVDVGVAVEDASGVGQELEGAVEALLEAALEAVRVKGVGVGGKAASVEDADEGAGATRLSL